MIETLPEEPPRSSHPTCLNYGVSRFAIVTAIKTPSEEEKGEVQHENGGYDETGTASLHNSDTVIQEISQ